MIYGNLCRRSWTHSWQKKERTIRNRKCCCPSNLHDKYKRENSSKIKIFSTSLNFSRSILLTPSIRRVLGRRAMSFSIIHRARSTWRRVSIRNVASFWSHEKQKHARWFTTTLLSWPMLRICLPFHSVALIIYVRNLAIDDEMMMMCLRMSLLVRLARFASLHYANPSMYMYNASLVLFEAIMRNGREGKTGENDGKRKDTWMVEVQQQQQQRIESSRSCEERSSIN